MNTNLPFRGLVNTRQISFYGIKATENFLKLSQSSQMMSI